MPVIKHIFVLMMENRSFDHALGFGGIPGVPPPDAALGMTADAPDRATLDPPHEFENVQAQIGGIPPMSGFRQQTYWNASRQGFGAGQLPVLTQLATDYFLFDNWYASLPGPTWPNRFFVHAASSGGLDNSPSPASTIESETVDSLSFTFQNGTLFERLQAAGRSWRVYHDDAFPQVLAIKNMIDPFKMNTTSFSWLRGATDYFVNDLANGYSVDYTFIEPNYGLLSGDFSSGNCQHPKGSMAAGEAFIKYIYESVRNSPVWPNSLLLITYDEHGGFFDRMNPQAAPSPGDDARNHDRAKNPQHFAFDQYGVRVPTIAISPWVLKGGLGSRQFPGLIFDHTSIIRGALDLFAPGQTLTQRDRTAPSMLRACSLETMRDGADLPLALPRALHSADQSRPRLALSSTMSLPESMTEGFSRIAMSLDLSVAADKGLVPIARAHPSFSAPMSSLGTVRRKPGIPRRTTQQTMDYIQSVAKRVVEIKGLAAH